MYIVGNTELANRAVRYRKSDACTCCRQSLGNVLYRKNTCSPIVYERSSNLVFNWVGAAWLCVLLLWPSPEPAIAIQEAFALCKRGNQVIDRAQGPAVILLSIVRRSVKRPESAINLLPEVAYCRIKAGGRRGRCRGEINVTRPSWKRLPRQVVQDSASSMLYCC